MAWLSVQEVEAVAQEGECVWDLRRRQSLFARLAVDRCGQELFDSAVIVPCCVYSYERQGEGDECEWGDRIPDSARDSREYRRDVHLDYCDLNCVHENITILQREDRTTMKRCTKTWPHSWSSGMESSE